MKLIHITGKKGSGKNVFLDVAKERGHVTEELEHGYQELIAKNHPRIAALPSRDQWEDHIIKAVFEECWLPKYWQGSPIFFTGLYRPSEITYLSGRAGVDLRIVAVDVKEDVTRYQRLLRRARSGEENLTLEDYKRKDLHRDGMPDSYKYNNVSAIMGMANYRISNDNGLEHFVLEAHKLINFIEKDFLRR